jgi:hypothetical protein
MPATAYTVKDKTRELLVGAGLDRWLAGAEVFEA